MQRFELTSPGGARLSVLDHGAAVDAWVPAPGSGASLVVARAPADRVAAAAPYCGVVVGRYANRIAGASVTIDGVEHRLDANEGSSTLHGGAGGFDRRTWEVVDRAPDRLVLRLESPDGDQGFPGRLVATAEYRLHDASVDVVLSAVTDAPTVVSLASHPYFDLGPEPVVTVPAELFLPVDERGVPLPGSAPVDGTPFDLRGGVSVSRESGFDHAWLVPGHDARVMASLAAADGSRRVEVLSDRPSVQVYTGGSAGGVAIEAQQVPDGPHRPGVDVVLRPGQTYRCSTRWTYAAADAR